MAYEATTNSIFQPYLKNLWHRGRVQDMAARSMPFYGMLKRSEDFFGEDRKVTVKYVNPQGRSATFTAAQTNARSGRGVRFSVTRKSNYGVCFLDGETIESTANNIGALYSALDDQLEGCMKNTLHDLQYDLCGDGGASRGQLSAAPSTSAGPALDSVTLLNSRDTRKYEVGQVLKAGSTTGVTATVFRTTPATNEIVKIDRAAGVLYFAANSFAGTNWNTNDHLYVEGDIDATSLLSKKVRGLGAWIPYTAPGASDSFNGINRSTDVERLSGFRRDLTGLALENGIIQLAADISEGGGDPDTALISPRQWANLEIGLGSKIRYEKQSGSGDMARYGWRAILLATENGDLKVMSDRGMPDDRTYVLTMDTWEFATLGEAPKPIQHDDNKVLRVSNADAVEFRCVYRGDLICNAPGWNGVGAIAT